jgi:hypothetical protein
MQVGLPKNKANTPYDIFHIEMTDMENSDRGEAVYYREKDNYK